MKLQIKQNNSIKIANISIVIFSSSLKYAVEYVLIKHYISFRIIIISRKTNKNFEEADLFKGTINIVMIVQHFFPCVLFKEHIDEMQQ